MRPSTKFGQYAYIFQSNCCQNAMFLIVTLCAVVKLFAGLYPLEIEPHYVFTGGVNAVTLGAMEWTSSVCFLLLGNDLI